MEVSEGRIPSDRIALRELCRELTAWPALDEPTSEWRREGAGRGGGGGAAGCWEGDAGPRGSGRLCASLANRHWPAGLREVGAPGSGRR